MTDKQFLNLNIGAFVTVSHGVDKGMVCVVIKKGIKGSFFGNKNPKDGYIYARICDPDNIKGHCLNRDLEPTKCLSKRGFKVLATY
jgi:hypothetical protein